MAQPESSELLRPKTIESTRVAETIRHLEAIRAEMEELRIANVLLQDQLSDAQKENRALRADLADTRHDLDACMRELNKRDE